MSTSSVLASSPAYTPETLQTLPQPCTHTQNPAQTPKPLHTPPPDLHNHGVDLVGAELELVAGQAVAQTQGHGCQVTPAQLTAG